MGPRGPSFRVAARAAGALGVDLTSFDNLVVDVTAQNGSHILRLILWDGSGVGISSSLAASIGTNAFALSAFATVDLSDIRQLAVRIDGAPGFIDITEIAVVPEPGSGVMIGAGLLVLGALARRTRARS